MKPEPVASKAEPDAVHPGAKPEGTSDATATAGHDIVDDLGLAADGTCERRDDPEDAPSRANACRPSHPAAMTPPLVPNDPAGGDYLNLLKTILTRYGFDQPALPVVTMGGPVRRVLVSAAQRLLAIRRFQLYREAQWDPDLRIDGRDWPADAETMIGLKRLDNIHDCVADVLVQGVPGDLIETGVWRGGATIFMRAVLHAHRDTERTVWVADSFRGLPKPDAEAYPSDKGDVHWTRARLAVSLDEVKVNFAKYGLLDDQVRFLPGWFSDTLPTAPIEQLAVLRLDGDMYGSTMDALRALYPKLAVGGYLIVDDYALSGCRAAVDDYRAEHGIREEVRAIDWSGIYWKREVAGGSRRPPFRHDEQEA